LLSFLGIFFLAPIIVAIMIVCFMDTRSSVFGQTRVGENMKPFLIF
jgi:lipopolysaccharide/colanic/teichoic acid biosynthesis glycosyltransferase